MFVDRHDLLSNYIYLLCENGKILFDLYFFKNLELVQLTLIANRRGKFENCMKNVGHLQILQNVRVNRLIT